MADRHRGFAGQAEVETFEDVTLVYLAAVPPVELAAAVDEEEEGGTGADEGEGVGLLAAVEEEDEEVEFIIDTEGDLLVREQLVIEREREQQRQRHKKGKATSLWFQKAPYDL